MASNQTEHISNDAKFYTEIELLKRDNAQLKEIFSKLDVSVEKIASAATNISKLLALHEQRVTIMSEDIIYFRESHTKFLDDIEILKKQYEIDNKELEQRVSKLEQYRWFLIGIATVIGYFINNLESITGIIHK
jgi:hypothetical protein